MKAQQLVFTLVEPTILEGEAHETNPIIFHFEGVNPGAVTVLVDILKFNASHPADWDISICTTSCLAPETDEAPMAFGAMLDDVFSIYFFPRSPGFGQVDVTVTSQVDSSNSFSTTLYLSAIALTGLNEAGPVTRFKVLPDRLDYSLSAPSRVMLTNLIGVTLLDAKQGVGVQSLYINNYKSGVYMFTSINQDGLTSHHRFYLE